jgi:hypothetical protein
LFHSFLIGTLIEQRRHLKEFQHYINYKTKKHPLHGTGAKTHLKFSLAEEKSLSSKQIQETEHFPLMAFNVTRANRFFRISSVFGKGSDEK